MSAELFADFVIITALEEERDALLSKLPGYQKMPPTDDDIRVYFRAELPVTYPDDTLGTYIVITLCLLGMGRLQALNATKDAINRWKPRYVLLVGIAGGVEQNEVSIGDILVSDLVVDYELQKVKEDYESYRFQPHNCDPRLVGAAQNLLGDAWSTLVKVSRPQEGKPKRHIGPVATGDKVIERKALVAQLLEPKSWPKLIGIEMEAGGAASGCFQSVTQPGFFMVRGVSDLADENKEAEDVKAWRSYACDIAAAYTIALLKSGPIPPRPIAKAVNELQTYTEHTLTTLPFGGGVLPSHRVPTQDVFIGRTNILSDLVASVASTHAIAILGIAGVGKTALIARAASHFGANNVFWYEMRAGLVSLDDILMQLARFLDGDGQFRGGLVNAIRDSRLTESDKIDLIITALNKGDYYLFFDSLHLIQDDAALNSLFSLLKEHLVNGAVFISSRTRPTFYTPVDEAKQKVRVVELGGLSESEAQEFLEQKGVKLSPETMEALDANFGGLPLALELIAALLVEGYEEARMSRLLNAAREKTIDYLFDEVYAGLGPDERNLLTTSSLFTFSFSQHELLNAHSALFAKGSIHECLNKLKRQFLVKHASYDQYEVHEVIRTLALENAGENLPQLRVRLADYLLEHNPDDFGSRVEAAFLYCKAEAFDQAAAEIGHLTEWALLPYYPNIAEALLRKVNPETVGPEQRVWLLGAHGELAHHWRRHEEAEKFYRSMLALAEELQNKSAVAIALQRLGILYVDRDSELSEQHYLNSLALKKELEDLEGQAEIYNNLGLLYSDRGQLAEAKSTLEKGLELREQINSPPWRRLPLYSNLGALYGKQQQWEAAAKYSEIAYQIAVEINSPYDIAKANYNLGKHEAEQGKHDAARRRYLSVLDIGEKYRLWEIQEMAQTALGMLSWKQGNAYEAIERFKAVAEIQERIEDKTKLVVTYFDIGTFYMQKGGHTSSLEYYEKGASLFEHLATDKLVRDFLKNMYVLAKQSEHPRRMAGILKQLKARLLGRAPSYALARVYEVLGRIYLNLLGKSRVALACFHKEISILAQLNRAEEQAGALINLGVTYEKLGRFGEAVNATTKGIEVAETHNTPKQLDIAFYNRGNFHTKLEMWEEAEADFNRSLEIAEQNHDTQFKRFALHNLGEMRRRQGRIEDALPLLQSSLSACREHGDVDGEIKTLNNIGLAYEEMGEGEEALRHFNAALELSRKNFRKRDEANVLISLGNYHLREGSPENAREHFEMALDAARAAEDTDMEENAMLSLAYAHRKLGTVNVIAADFKAVAERAGTLKHHDNLISFLIFAGETSLDEREIEAAAEMFENALAVALNSAAGQLLRSIDKPSPFSKIESVLLSMLEGLDKAAQARAIEEAQDFCKRLTDRLTDIDKWGRAGLWLANTYIKPLKDYFDELPDQSLPDYVFGGWRRRETENSSSDADDDG